MIEQTARMGRFTLDEAKRQLEGPAGKIALRPKTFAVLSYLAKYPGRVVGKGELLEAVWPNVNVGDDAIAHCIFEARSAMGGDGKSLIKTVPRHGYVLDIDVGRPQQPSDWERNLIRRSDILPFARDQDLAVVATASSTAVPHCAIIRYRVTDDLEIVFSSHHDTDQVRDLMENAKASVTIGCNSSRTLQLAGSGRLLEGQERDCARDVLRAAFSERYPGRHLIEGIRYLKIEPQWLRFSDFRLNPASILTVDLVDGSESRSARIIRTSPRSL